VYLRGVEPADPMAGAVRASIKSSSVARALVAELMAADPETRDGVDTMYHTLRYLADIEYPAGDRSLGVYRDRVHAWLHQMEMAYDGPLHIRDKYRVHGSFHGNALYWAVALGLANAETDTLAQNLLRYQWPGGGWNCNKKPGTKGPTIVHTAYGMRGLVRYRERKHSEEVRSAIDACAEVMLERRVYLSRRNGKPLRPVFTKLSYPYPRLYDFMVGLHILARSGHLSDPRCEQALDLLESKFIDGEGWAVERTVPEHTHAFWNREKNGRANLFLTVDALEILEGAGRLR